MALGDGTTWDETEPTESTEASLAPVYINDDRVGTRKRMQNEHFWPAAQTSVNQGGQLIWCRLVWVLLVWVRLIWCQIVWCQLI